MELNAEDIDRLGQAIKRFERYLDTGDKGPKTMGNSTIMVNAGGVGLWIAVACCACMFCMLMLGSLFALYNFQSIDREVDGIHASESKMQAYLNVIYQKAPQLKPEKEQDHGK